MRASSGVQSMLTVTFMKAPIVSRDVAILAEAHDFAKLPDRGPRAPASLPMATILNISLLARFPTKSVFSREAIVAVGQSPLAQSLFSAR